MKKRQHVVKTHLEKKQVSTFCKFAGEFNQEFDFPKKVAGTSYRQKYETVHLL